MNLREPMQDFEYARAREEGLEASCPQLLLALACFIVAMFWSLTVGAWMRLGRRLFGRRTKPQNYTATSIKLEPGNFSQLQNPS